MPRIQRSDLPRALFAHLLDRIKTRNISADQLGLLAEWLDTKPEVPVAVFAAFRSLQSAKSKLQKTPKRVASDSPLGPGRRSAWRTCAVVESFSTTNEGQCKTTRRPSIPTIK